MSSTRHQQQLCLRLALRLWRLYSFTLTTLPGRRRRKVFIPLFPPAGEDRTGQLATRQYLYPLSAAYLLLTYGS
uniref:Uncharacterized protein n=1 Tax=Zea mays TaxID=4577 RepID=C4J184_MAIZE|nr:unknown [Zea mays]